MSSSPGEAPESPRRVLCMCPGDPSTAVNIVVPAPLRRRLDLSGFASDEQLELPTRSFDTLRYVADYCDSAAGDGARCRDPSFVFPAATDTATDTATSSSVALPQHTGVLAVTDAASAQRVLDIGVIADYLCLAGLAQDAAAALAAFVRPLLESVELPVASPADLSAELARCVGEDPTRILAMDCVDLGSGDGLRGLPGRPEWEPDADVTTCSSCAAPFLSLPFVGAIPGSKSHCRVCRKVRCRACVQAVLKYPGASCYKPEEDPDAPVKCCPACLARLPSAAKTAFLEHLCETLSVLEVAKAALFGPEWAAASANVLSRYGASLASVEIASQERSMLLASAPLLGGHPQQVVRLFEAVDFARDEPMAEKALTALRETVEMCARGTAPRFAHRHMMCRRACLEPMLDLVGAQLLRALSGVDVAAAPPRCQAVVVEARRVAQQLLVEHARSEAQRMCWVPILLDLLHRDLPGEAGDSVIDTLLALCEGQSAVAMQAYRECIARRRDLGPGESFLERLLDTVRSRVERLPGVFPDVRRLHSASAFVDSVVAAAEAQGDTPAACLHEELKSRGLVRHESTLLDCVMGDGVVTVEPFPYIFDPSITIVAVHLGGVCVKRSKMRPWEVPLIPEGAASPAEYRKVLYKREDVRKDYVVCNVVAALDGFFRRKQLLTHHIARYRVLPTSKESGIIEMVSGATSVDDIARGQSREEAQAPMRSWMDAHLRPPATPDRAFGERILEGASFYLLVTYLLGVGDRHRGKVLLTPDGGFCHTAFSVVLEETRAWRYPIRRFAPEPCVRYDTDLKEAIPVAASIAGRATDDDVADFWRRTALLFAAVRPYAGLLHVLVGHLVDRDLVAPGTVAQVLQDRTFAGLGDDAASAAFTQHAMSACDATALHDGLRGVMRTAEAWSGMRGSDS